MPGDYTVRIDPVTENQAAVRDLLVDETGSQEDVSDLIESGGVVTESDDEAAARALADRLEALGAGVAIERDDHHPEEFVVEGIVRTEPLDEETPLEAIDGIGATRAEALHEVGYRTVADVRTATPEALTEAHDIGAVRAEEIIETVRGRPVPGVTVKAYDRDLRSEQLVGEATTDEEGHYEISYSSEAFQRAEQDQADLVFRVFSRTGDDLAAEADRGEVMVADGDGQERRVIFDADPHETVNLTVDATRLEPSEYERVETELTPLLEDIAPAELTDEDRWFLTNETDLDRAWIDAFASSDTIARDTGLPSEPIYGLIRSGLPATRDELLDASPEAVEAALTDAVAENIVREAVMESLDDILDRFTEETPPAQSGVTPGRIVSGAGVNRGRLTTLDGATADVQGMVEVSGNDLVFSGDGAVRFDGPARRLEEFTLEAAAAPDRIGGRQSVVESRNPPAALFVEADGSVTGSVNTADGWQSVQSGDVKMQAGEERRLRLSRDRDGVLRLEVDNEEVAVEHGSETLADGDDSGFSVGAATDGTSRQFAGRITDIRVRETAVSAADLRSAERRSRELAGRLSEHVGAPVTVETDTGTVDHRLDHVKSIMQAAGVEDASELSTLTVDEPTPVQRGTVMVAPRTSTGPSVDWSQFARRAATLSDEDLANEVATTLVNRNSIPRLEIAESENDDTNTPDVSSLGDSAQPGIVEPQVGTGNSVVPVSLLGRRSRLPGIAADSDLARRQPPRVAEMMNPEGMASAGVTPEAIGALESEAPSAWPGTDDAEYSVMSLETLPVDSAVIIAGTLDLRSTRLRIEPEVTTLYIIAEEVVCDDDAEITWRQPGGSTPDREVDPSKDGRSWSGVHTGDDRNGLPGGDGSPGEPGIKGANGRDAPSIELWVKELTEMPNIDLKGEQGIAGGRGQPGGDGGDGAKGKMGKWYWAFGKHCWKQPGHGGDGGDGADGGRGGRGGNGGRGGDIEIGVLEGTLEETVTSRSFKLNNDGGDPGDGGPGGPRGRGGDGGPHGNSYVDDEEVCTKGKEGADGQHGRRGDPGREGRRGDAGEITFREFSEESWDEQLTKPWLTDVSPDAAFPGDTLLLSGSRFADTDEVVLDGDTLTPTLLPDGRLEVTIPGFIAGGRKEVYVRRHDGTESNDLQVWIRPRLDSVPTTLTPGTTARLEGRAFLPDATVAFDGAAIPATVNTARELEFDVPEPDGTGAEERDVTVAVRNPDGYVSNEETATLPQILKNGFEIGVHDFAFANFDEGAPSWNTFEETFGAFEVWHEQLDPVYGHPVLTPAFYWFYHEFLKGEARDGLATGFCTALASVALDEYWTGSDDTHERYELDAETRQKFTAVHGRLLSRESLTRMHDQSREELARVERSFDIIEDAFEHGSRENAPLLFFIPSGAVWDADYIEGLEESHCVVPIRIEYPVGHDGSDLDGVTLYVWDNNHPGDSEGHDDDAQNCRVEFFRDDGDIHFEYYDGDRTSDPEFSSQDGITLGTQTLDEYLLSDVDMPFSGPHGLKRFIVDFLLSPADLTVTDDAGRVTGVEGGQLKAEIPDSHPVYLRRRAVLLPVDTALTRTITGGGTGTYDYHSLSPRDTSISLEAVATAPGEEDVLRVNADGTQVRFEPGTQKTVDLTLGRRVDGQVRGLNVGGVAGGPSEEVDVTLSNDLSAVRVGNRGPDATVDVKLIGMDTETASNTTIDRRGITLPTENDLTVMVTDWEDLSMDVRTVPFES